MPTSFCLFGTLELGICTEQETSGGKLLLCATAFLSPAGVPTSLTAF